MNKANCPTFPSTLQSVYEYVNRSLSFIEAKNGSLVVYNTALLLGALQFIQNKNSFEHPTLSSLFIFSTLLLVFSLLIALWSFKPKRSSKEIPKQCIQFSEANGDESKQILLESIYSTEGLSSIGNENFITFLRNQDSEYEPTDADRALISCTLHMARVSSRKYKLFRCALCIACIGTIVNFLSCILYF